MSSNPHHNNLFINRSNYEEYLLLYVDNELTAEEKVIVDQFLLLHPDLQSELELLQQAKLPEELVYIKDKATLFSNNMSIKNMEEELLLYMDNELAVESKLAVKEQINNNSDYRQQYELLLKTQSNSSEIIVCPFKKNLYKKKRKKLLLISWRAAAAILLIAGLAVTIIVGHQKPPDVAVGPAPTDNKFNPAIVENNNEETIPAIKNRIANKVNNIKKNDKAQTLAATIQKTERELTINKGNNKAANKHHQLSAGNYPDIEELNPARLLPKSEIDLTPMPSLAKNKVKKSLTQRPVTLPPLYAFNQTDASIKTPSADETEKPKQSLKGLLRQATRFVENRTNVSITNNDDELLIGSIAINLK